jgi:hypothetical protein
MERLKRVLFWLLIACGGLVAISMYADMIYGV